MQFKSIVTVLSLALAVAASPTSNPPASSQTCAQGETLKCCNKATTSGGGVSLVSIGDILTSLLQCNAVVQVLGVAGCSGGQKLNCCNTSNSGSINILSNDCTNVL